METVDGEMRVHGVQIGEADGLGSWTEPLAGYAADGAGFACAYFKQAELAIGSGCRPCFTVQVN